MIGWGSAHWQVPVITGQETDGEVKVVLGEEAGLEVWTEEVFCLLAGGEGVVEPALGEGHGGRTREGRVWEWEGRDWTACCT